MSRVNSWFAHFVQLSWYDRFNQARSGLTKLKTSLIYSRVFGSVGQGSKIFKPVLLANPRHIYVGSHTLIRAGCRMEVVVIDPRFPPRLIIGDRVNIEQNVHLICSHRLVIGDNVTITGNCAIVDTDHPFRDLEDPRKVGERISAVPTPVEIGMNTFIGFGTVILPNVRIGRNCMIGANSTVTRDIPDYCVAAGNPARVLERYDTNDGKWVSIDKR